MITVIFILLSLDIGLTIDNHYKIRKIEIIQKYGNFPSCKFPNDPRWEDYDDECEGWEND